MIKVIIIVLFLSFPTMAMSGECKFNNKSVSQSLRGITQMLENNEIKEISIRYFSVEFYSRSPFPIWALEASKGSSSPSASPYPEDYNLKTPFDKRDGLISALKKTVINKPKDESPPDLRRRIKFFDQHRRLVGSIYFGARDTYGIRVYINNICADISLEVYDWMSYMIDNKQ